MTKHARTMIAGLAGEIDSSSSMNAERRKLLTAQMTASSLRRQSKIPRRLIASRTALSRKR